MKETKAKLTTQMICFVGLFGALSTILMLFQVPLFFVPGFMKLDIAELPAILGAFMFGPVAGESIVFVKIILNLLIDGTDTMYVGELSNLLLSSIYVLCASLIYHRRKTKRRAALSLLISVVLTSTAAVISNTFVTFPAYAVVYGLSMDKIVEMAQAVNPLVCDAVTMMIWSILPFNLIKYGAVSVLTFMLYKKLHLCIQRYILK